jgi:hypothetical protein
MFANELTFLARDIPGFGKRIRAKQECSKKGGTPTFEP